MLSEHRKRRTFDEVLCNGYLVGYDARLKDLLIKGLEDAEKQVKDRVVLVVNDNSKPNKIIINAMLNGDITAKVTIKPELLDPIHPILFERIYKVREADFKAIVNKGRLFPNVNLPTRHAMMRRLPCYVPGYALPIPDTQNVNNKVQGILKRICRVGSDKPIITPTCDQLSDLRSFVRSLLHHNYKPISPDYDMSFETWLWTRNVTYTNARRKELMDTYLNMCQWAKANPKTRVAKTFIKREDYTKIKYPRLINAMQDYVKVRLAAAARAMEDAIYENATTLPILFVKHFPVAERAVRIRDHLERTGHVYTGSDFGSFESSLNKRIMEVIEQQLYGHFLKNFENLRSEFALMARANRMVSKGVKCSVVCRMSGEMTTSLGNGFSNMVIALYVAKITGNPIIAGVVEGDDGLFTTARPLDLERAAEFGFDITAVQTSEVGEAGFCGLYFDSNEVKLIRDPAEVIVRLGWTKSQQFLHAGPAKMRSLLKAKVASALYETPCCPVVSPLCYEIWKMLPEKALIEKEDAWWTEHVIGQQNLDEMPQWILNGLQELKEDKCPSTRALFERLFHVNVAMQRDIERKVREMRTLGPLNMCIPLIQTNIASEEWRIFHDDNVYELKRGTLW